MTLLFLVLSLPICPGPCFDWCTFPFLTQISRLTRRRPVLHPVWAVVLFVPKYSLCVRTCSWCFFLLGCSFLCLYLSDKMKLNSSLEVSLQPSSISQEGSLFPLHSALTAVFTQSVPWHRVVPVCLLNLLCLCLESPVPSTMFNTLQMIRPRETAKSFLCRAKLGLGQDSLFLNYKDLENSHIWRGLNWADPLAFQEQHRPGPGPWSTCSRDLLSAYWVHVLSYTRWTHLDDNRMGQEAGGVQSAGDRHIQGSDVPC